MDRDIFPIIGEIILLAIGGIFLLQRLGRLPRSGRRRVPVRLCLLLIAFLLASLEIGLYANSAQAAMLH